MPSAAPAISPAAQRLMKRAAQGDETKLTTGTARAAADELLALGLVRIDRPRDLAHLTPAGRFAASQL